MANRQTHRANLVRTAMRLFRRQGYAATGLQQILAESGAPRGSLYHYFPAGKGSLAEAAVVMAGDLVSEMLQQHFDKTRSAKAFAARVCATYAEWMREGAFMSGCPIATTMLECAPNAPAIAAAGEQAHRRWIAIAAQAFERDGHGRAAATRRATAFIAAIQGGLILARVQRTTQPLLDVAATFAAPGAIAGSGKTPARRRRASPPAHTR